MSLPKARTVKQGRLKLAAIVPVFLTADASSLDRPSSLRVECLGPAARLSVVPAFAFVHLPKMQRRFL
jgi:hypothetical protein